MIEIMTATQGEDLADREDFMLWEEEMALDPDVTTTFDQLVDDDQYGFVAKAVEEEPQISWVDSNPNGTSTEEQYRQQCYWVIGQFGHAIDCARGTISNDVEAREWLDMKMTIAAAKAETDPFALAGIRSEMIPYWNEYIARMNYDTAQFARVCNR